jgi:hypothetical protein
MPINPLNLWKSSLADLTPVDDTSWAANFATWYADNIASISPDPASLVAPGFTFTFQQSIFQAQLLTLMPTPDALLGITGFANAWEAAILSSIVVVAPGAFIPPTAPTTLFSVVISTIIDPASIVVAKTKILDLATAEPVANVNDSKFPEIFREATLQLKINVIGLDSTPPPASPLPLTAMNVPLV